MKKLVWRCDDFGTASGANEALLALAQTGLKMNVSVLICAPHARESLEKLAAYTNVCLGIHTAVTSEWDAFKWGPVANATRQTKLVDANGNFYPNYDVPLTVAPEIIAAETRAQIARALSWGIPFRYFDEHMCFNWMQGITPQHRLLAKEFNLIYQPDLPLLPDIQPVPANPFSPQYLHLRFQAMQEQKGAYLVMTHPARYGESTLKFQNPNFEPGSVARERDQEFQTFLSPGWPECLRDENVELVTYLDL